MPVSKSKSKKTKVAPSSLSRKSNSRSRSRSRSRSITHDSSKTISRKQRKRNRKLSRKKRIEKLNKQSADLPASASCMSKGVACAAGCGGIAAVSGCTAFGGKKRKAKKKRRSMCTRLTTKECKQPRYTKRCKVTKSKNKGKHSKRPHCRTRKNKRSK